MSVWEALIELSVYVGGTARKDEVGRGIRMYGESGRSQNGWRGVGLGVGVHMHVSGVTVESEWE